MVDDEPQAELDELYTALVTAVLNNDSDLLNLLLDGMTFDVARRLALVGVMNAVEAVLAVAEHVEEDPLEMWQRSLLEGDAFDI